MKPGLFTFKGKKLSLLGRMIEMIATQRGSCQDHTKITGRRVSQLKKYLCYDNFGFDKKSFQRISGIKAPFWRHSV
jgi:hypothetical protein